MLVQHSNLPEGLLPQPLPIDGAWVTPDLPLDAATWLEFLPHLGDHCFNVLGIKAQALVGENVLRIVCPPAWCLACTVPHAVSMYLKHLKTHLDCHQVLPKLHQLYVARDGNFTHPQWRTLECLDRVQAEGM